VILDGALDKKNIYQIYRSLPEKGVVHESNCLGIKLVLGGDKPPPFWRAHILEQSARHFLPVHIRTILKKKFSVHNGALPMRSHSNIRKTAKNIFKKKERD
jgi:hypothetical protein